jgi:hypothetical protein
MDNFKQASKQKLRVSTTKGNLSVEQLWDLSLTDLDTLAVELETAYNESKGKSFLTKKTSKDKDIKLAFDVTLEILEAKVQDNNRITEEKERKEHNQKILGIIAEKKEDALKGKSLKELEAMLQ